MKSQDSAASGSSAASVLEQGKPARILVGDKSPDIHEEVELPEGRVTIYFEDGTFAILQTDHDRLQEFNPANGWGNYDLLVRFTAGYLAACERWPDAEVSVSR